MKIYGFKAKIKKVEYKEIESKSDFAENTYLAQCLIAEIKQGRSHYEARHNVGFYLTKEEYENKILDVGDIVELSDGIKWVSSLINFNVYDEEKLKEFPSKMIKTDQRGKPYVPQKAFAYYIKAPIGKWKIDTKFTEIFYWSFGKIKVPMDDGTTPEECEAEFLNQTQYEFYLDNKEYESVKDFEGNFIINGYKRKNLVARQPFNVKFERVESIDRWKTTLTKLEG